MATQAACSVQWQDYALVTSGFLNGSCAKERLRHGSGHGGVKNVNRDHEYSRRKSRLGQMKVVSIVHMIAQDT